MAFVQIWDRRGERRVEKGSALVSAWSGSLKVGSARTHHHGSVREHSPRVSAGHVEDQRAHEEGRAVLLAAGERAKERCREVRGDKEEDSKSKHGNV